MRKVYAPLDVKITHENCSPETGPLIHTIYLNYILLSVKIIGLSLVIFFFIKQLLHPAANLQEIQIDFSKPFQGVFLPLFALGICFYYLGRELYFITRKVRLYYRLRQIKGIFYKRELTYDSFNKIIKTFEAEKIRNPDNPASYFYTKKWFYEIHLNNGEQIKFAKRDFFKLEKRIEDLKQNLVYEK